MKIKIITFHNTLNFGATLQCTAFSEYLSGLGHDVGVIDYLPEYVLNKKSAFKELKKIKKSKNKPKALVKGIAYAFVFRPIKRKDKKTDAFLGKHVKLTRVYNTITEMKKDPPAADLYFCGSDQIWKPSLTGDKLDECFFLRFTEGKKASYGASLGVEDIEPNAQKLKEWTEDYLGISVREKSVSEALSAAIDRKVSVVLDCTLLLEKENYQKLEDSVSGIETPYLLLYNVQSSERSMKLAKRIAAEKKLRIIDVSPNPFVKSDGVEKRLDAGPGEFLTLIKNAEFVVTNSFHGTVFSIIYEKAFFASTPSIRGGRILDLLDLLELSDRCMQDNEVSFDAPIDYGRVKALLKENREISIRYINDMIAKAGDRSQEE